MFQRRIIILLVLATAFVFMAGSLLFGGVPQYSPPKIFKTPLTHEAHEAPPTAKDGGPLYITITETGGSHDEVVAALVHSFGSQRNAVIDLYQLLPRYRIVDIMQSFTLSNPLPKPKGPSEFINHGVKERRPDIFVAGTCELDLKTFSAQLTTLLADRKTFMFCIIHHSDRWADEKLGLEEAVRPWVEAGMVEFLTLSPHTANFLKEYSIKKWKTTTKPVVRSLVPVFPVPLPAVPAGNGIDKEELSFGLQGDYDPSRRDYNNIFIRLKDFLKNGGSSANSAGSLDESNDRNVTMHLLGHGKHPDVPAEVQAHVKFDEQLDYQTYYSIISRTFALLPAFASKEYLDRKASSSVPASLIGGVPLVATQSIVDAYSYLDRDVVWLQGDNEKDLDVVGRILEMGPKERRKKKELVRRKCATIVDSNVKEVEGWISAVLEKMKR
ncbi:hypothetical protein FN846DRAFT_776324 [Sphaerosporella brunnea]|uniref:Glycosyltransferase family 1 protein n=1 Tax=Sphaerosporella brunnea TaxID=1250544 RepID=A0A5J5F1F7_9PEZI|nr:hypothetical protein FN846DRAFT_776324 [Sphaerosporella brunnea]